MNLSRLLIISVLLVTLTGCARLYSLKDDLKTYNATVTEFSGEIKLTENSTGMIVLVALSETDHPMSYEIFERPGRFNMIASRSTHRVLAFQDEDGDLTFDNNEPFADLVVAQSHAEGRTGMQLELSRHRSEASPGTKPGQRLFGLRNKLTAEIDVRLGNIASLDDSRFSGDMAEVGMWQPTEFMHRGLAGIYFLEPYSATKIPVLFVHGANGSPANFQALAAKIDRKVYQPWFFYYPSGLAVPTVSTGLLRILNELRAEKQFTNLHIVAHSLGGLVSRSLLTLCHEENECSYIRSLTSISSPFGGVKAAKSGIAHSPVVMPVWRNMDPDSEFIATLFTRPIPAGISHHIIFGFRNDSTFSSASGDGTIPLESQLPAGAQEVASSIMGYNENHTAILDNALVASRVDSILKKSR